MSSTDPEHTVEVDFAVLSTSVPTIILKDSSSSNTPSSSKKVKEAVSGRHNCLKCYEHEDSNKNIWTSIHSTCKLCTRFSIVSELKESVLPRTVDVFNLLLALKDARKGHSSDRDDAILDCAKLLTLRWQSCNVYTISLKSVKKHLNNLFAEYRTITKYSSKSDSYWKKCTPFLEKMSELFDIEADSTIQKAWFRKTGIPHDKDFYDGQKLNPPRGYSTRKTDKKWEKTAARRKQILNQQTASEASKSDPCDLVEFDDEEDKLLPVDSDDEFHPTEDGEPVKAKYRFEFVDDEDDEMPVGMRHLRSSMRNVRPEVYSLMTVLKSKFHMSQTQAEAAIVHVGNMLFKRNWKVYDPESPTDKNTLPAGSNMRRVEPYLEAMALASIVEEVMAGAKMIVTYSNDGSAMSGVGNYVVQSFTINNVQRALPTFSIFTESR